MKLAPVVVAGGRAVQSGMIFQDELPQPLGPDIPVATEGDTLDAIEGAIDDLGVQSQKFVDLISSQWESISRFVIVAALAVVFVLVVHYVVFAIARRAAMKTKLKGDEIIVRLLRGPSRLILALLAVYFVLPQAQLNDAALGLVRHGISLLLIAAMTWLVVRIVQSISQFVLAQYETGTLFDTRARRVQTQMRVLSRILSVVAVIVGVAAALMTFDTIKQLGASILASAGITGLIVGLAAQKVIANFLAGLQIAFTGPINIGDVVVIEGEWGRIEEITTTYVILKIWDERRLIVPFSKIIDSTFYNWSRSSSEVLGTIYIYADYQVPIDAVRAETVRIVNASVHWDGRTCGLVVTDATERAVELRVVISAADGSKQWDLRCEVREELIKYLQREHPECLPRTRMVIADERVDKSKGTIFNPTGPVPD